MGFATRVSLEHEYELFVEREIEDYKERVSRGALLKIADEAVQRLHEQEQVTLNELVLCVEVDRMIAGRLRIPAYTTWVRRRRRQLEVLRKPESWGLSPDEAVVRNLPTTGHSHVLVARPHDERTALFLAANGCQVTALESEADIIDRVMQAAEQHGLAARVNLLPGDLEGWSPDSPLAAVFCTPEAFAGLSLADRDRVLQVLQSATRDGGVHLVETILAGKAVLAIEELRAAYDGWEISVEGDAQSVQTFVARKA